MDESINLKINTPVLLYGVAYSLDFARARPTCQFCPYMPGVVYINRMGRFRRDGRKSDGLHDMVLFGTNINDVCTYTNLMTS